jgi:hypothetical protein
MNHNNNPPLNNNVNNIQDEFIIDNDGYNSYSNNLLPTDVTLMEQQLSSNALNSNLSISYDIPTLYAANNYEQQSMSSSINNEHATLTVTQSYPINLSNSSYSQQQSNYYVNSPPLNFNNSGIFRFEIPGFEIFVIPTSNSTNLSMQNQFQQDHAYQNIITNNPQTQSQQQSSLDVNDSFIDSNNFRG